MATTEIDPTGLEPVRIEFTEDTGDYAAGSQLTVDPASAAALVREGKAKPADQPGDVDPNLVATTTGSVAPVVDGEQVPQDQTPPSADGPQDQASADTAPATVTQAATTEAPAPKAKR